MVRMLQRVIGYISLYLCERGFVPSRVTPRDASTVLVNVHWRGAVEVCHVNHGRDD